MKKVFFFIAFSLLGDKNSLILLPKKRQKSAKEQDWYQSKTRLVETNSKAATVC